MKSRRVVVMRAFYGEAVCFSHAGDDPERLLDEEALEARFSMAPYVLDVDDLLFPVLLLHANGWIVWRDAEQGKADPHLQSLRPGGPTLLPSRRVQARVVDSSGTMHDIAEVEDTRVDITRLPRAERIRAIRSGPSGYVRLVCTGTPRPAAIQDVVDRIAWIVSARGHFENPEGFGLRADVTSAYTFPDLLEALSRQR